MFQLFRRKGRDRRWVALLKMHVDQGGGCRAEAWGRMINDNLMEV